MKVKDIVIVGILLGIGAIVRYVSLIAPGPITSNLVIAFYSLAIVLVVPKVTESLGIGIVAGIVCALISHSIFPPANLISESIGALVAIGTIIAVNKLSSQEGRKDNAIGYGIIAIGGLSMILFVLIMFMDPENAFGISLLTASTNKIILGTLAVALLLAGLYFIPNKLGEYKAAITSLMATLSSGLSFIAVAALVIFETPGLIFVKSVPPIDVFVLSALPIVIGCAIINMILAQVLYIPAKKAMR